MSWPRWSRRAQPQSRLSILLNRPNSHRAFYQGAHLALSSTFLHVLRQDFLAGCCPSGKCSCYDRAWGTEKAVFGKVRYMSSANTQRKLRLKEYLSKWSSDTKLQRHIGALISTCPEKSNFWIKHLAHRQSVLSWLLNADSWSLESINISLWMNTK